METPRMAVAHGGPMAFVDQGTPGGAQGVCLKMRYTSKLAISWGNDKA